MLLSAEMLRMHLRYNFWANRRLRDAIDALTPEEQARDFATGHSSVAGTLAHMFASERIWLARLAGAAEPPDWASLEDRWRAWAVDLTDAGAVRAVSYTDRKGEHWSHSTYQIVLQVVNHSTHHRGQISGFLRALGHTPPRLDFIVFVRER